MSPKSPSIRHRQKPPRYLSPFLNRDNPPPRLRYSPPIDLTPSAPLSGRLPPSILKPITGRGSSNARFQHIYHNCVWQETVDAVSTSLRERIKINEALMGLLFRLDSVPGHDPNIRELRRHVSRKIVRLQEILDGIRMDSLSDWVDISVNDFS